MRPIQEYATLKIVRLIEMLEDSPDQSYINPKISFIILALQRISLIFPMNEFAGEAYQDLVLKQLANFVNWTTGQTPLKLISSEYVAIWVLFIIFLTHLSMSFIIFLTFCQNGFTSYLLRLYSTILFTLIITPSMLLATSNKYNNLPSIYGLALIPIIGNYIILGYANRCYHLSYINPYCKKYSPFNYFELIGNLVCLVLYQLLPEGIFTICLFIFSLISLLGAFLFNPFILPVNKLYSYTAIAVFLMTVVKALAFTIAQHHILHIILILVPLMGIILEQLRLRYNQPHQTNLTVEQLIQVVEPLIDQKSYKNIQQLILLTQIQIQYQFEGRSVLDTISFLFKQTLDKHYKLNINIWDNQVLETLCLYYVNFLAYKMHQPLQAYIALKTLETKQVGRSLYFRAMAMHLARSLFNIYSKYNLPRNEQVNSVRIAKLSIKGILQVEKLAHTCVNQVNEIMNAKIKFWDDLAKGYQRIEDFSDSACILSQLIWNVRDEIFKELNITQGSPQFQKFDAIQLKILALLFSVVLNDYYSTIEIGVRMEEVLQYERSVQTNEVLSATYMNDQVVLIQMSLIRNRGKIVNRSNLAIEKFFGYTGQENVNSLTQVEQLMPKFLAQRHNQFIDKFVQSGHSKLFESSNEMIYQFCDGFHGQGNLKLAHIFENVNDYVLTGAMSRSEQQGDFIVFDDNGKIISISKKAFAMLTESENLEVDQIVEKCYIYFWFPEIIEIIYQDLLISRQSQNEDRVSNFICEFYNIKNLSEVIKINTDFWMKQIPMAFKQQDNVELKEGVNLKLLRQSMREYSFEFFRKLIKLNQISNDDKIQIQLSITVNLIGRSEIPIYILKIQQISSTEVFLTSTRNFTTLFHQDSLNSNCTSNNQIYSNKNCEFNIDEAPILEFNILTCRKNESQFGEELLISEQNNGLNKQAFQNEEQHRPDPIKEQLSESKSRVNDSVEFHQEQQPKLDLIQIYKNNIGKIQQPLRSSIQSTTTTGNTHSKMLYDFKNIQYSSKLSIPIVQALFTTSSLIIILSSLMVAEIVNLRIHTTILQERIPLVRLSDKFNRLYCTFTTIGEYDITGYVLNSTYGEYYDYRKIQESREIRKVMATNIQQLVDEFSKNDNNGSLHQISIYIINEFDVFNKTTTFTEFSSMVNEHTQSVDYYLTQFTYLDMFHQQIEMQFLKANLQAQIQLTTQIVETIITDFFLDIEENQNLQLIFLIVKLLFITILTGIQFGMWNQVYKNQQRALMLISRVQITDIEIIKSQYQNILHQLERSSIKWKQIDYSEIVYPKQNAIRGVKPNLQTSKQFKGTFTSKIYGIQFSITSIIVKLFLICTLLGLGEVSQYYYQSYVVESSQPEIQLCMKFVKFKSNFSGLLILAQLLKNQPQLAAYAIKEQLYKRNPHLNTKEEYYKLLYDPYLPQFQQTYDATFKEYNLIYEKIVASTQISDQNKQSLLDLYQSDICQQQVGELFPFCNYDNGSFANFPNYPVPRVIDNNREVLKQGINGIVNQVKSILSSYYVQEQQGKKDEDEIVAKQFLDSPAYIQVIFAYFFDINKAFITFLEIIVDASGDILELGYQHIVIFDCTIQIISFTIVLTVVIWRLIRLQRQMKQTLQALIMLPHNRLLEPSTYNALKIIVQEQ